MPQNVTNIVLIVSISIFGLATLYVYLYSPVKNLIEKIKKRREKK